MLDVDGDVIDGLYAAGNAMGSIMRMTYGGHGGTLGPGLVFGYLAGRDAAARAAAAREATAWDTATGVAVGADGRQERSSQ